MLKEFIKQFFKESDQLKNQPQKIEFSDSSTENFKNVFLSFNRVLQVLPIRHLRNFSSRVKIRNTVTARCVESYITFLLGIETKIETSINSPNTLHNVPFRD